MPNDEVYEAFCSLFLIVREELYVITQYYEFLMEYNSMWVGWWNKKVYKQGKGDFEVRVCGYFWGWANDV